MRKGCGHSPSEGDKRAMNPRVRGVMGKGKEASRKRETEKQGPRREGGRIPSQKLRDERVPSSSMIKNAKCHRGVCRVPFCLPRADLAL